MEKKLLDESKTLTINISNGEKLCGKNNRNGQMTSSPYCVLTVLGKDGLPSSKDRKTQVVKDSLDPVWAETFKVEVGREKCGGIKVAIWDRHRVRSDKFMGQVILKFADTKLMSSEEILDDWFKLEKRGKNETVSGRIKLKVQYGNLIVKEEEEKEEKQEKTEKTEKKKKREEKKDAEKKEKKVEVRSDKPSPSTKDKEKEKKAKKNQKLRESPAGWNSQDSGLGASKWVRIKDIKPTEPYPFPREGPHNVSLSNIPRSNLTINKYSLSNNNCSMGMAKTDVKVRGNKWYFEVTIKNTGNNIYVGWVSDLFTQWGDKTGWFTSCDGQKWIGSNGQQYGPRWNNGDVIGCGLDLYSGEIHVAKNGVAFPGKFAFDMVKRGVDVGEHFFPAIGLSGYGSADVNLGEAPLKHLMIGYYPLHFVLSTVQQDKVRDLFHTFRKAGQDDEGSDEDEERINFNGTLALAKQLDINPTEDIGLLLIAWKLNCSTTFEFSLEEWMIGWSVQGCVTLEDFRNAIKKWNKDVEDPNNYTTFYAFCGDYLKEGKKVLPISEAISAWDLILKPRDWPLYNEWKEFVQDNVKAVNPDTWNMLWKFICEFPKDMKSYNEADCWPYTFDEFHDWYMDKYQ